MFPWTGNWWFDLRDRYQNTIYVLLFWALQAYPSSCCVCLMCIFDAFICTCLPLHRRYNGNFGFGMWKWRDKCLHIWSDISPPLSIHAPDGFILLYPFTPFYLLSILNWSAVIPQYHNFFNHSIRRPWSRASAYLSFSTPALKISAGGTVVTQRNAERGKIYDRLWKFFIWYKVGIVSFFFGRDNVYSSVSESRGSRSVHSSRIVII